MATAKLEIERFTEKNDSALWKVKMVVLLMKQSLAEALDGELGFRKILLKKKKEIIMKKTHNAIILSLGDSVPREVSKEKTAEQI